MKKNLTTRQVVLDTPNILFYQLYKRKHYTEKNSNAILNLLASDVKIIASITPKMLKEIPRISEFLMLAIRSNDGLAIFTKNNDPDEVVLQIADEQKIPIITNDKFRQTKYKKYKSKKRFIRYIIEKQRLIPIDDFWKNYLMGEKSID